MAANKRLLELVKAMIHDGRRGMPVVGEASEQALRELQTINQP